MTALSLSITNKIERKIREAMELNARKDSNREKAEEAQQRLIKKKNEKHDRMPANFIKRKT